MKRVVIDHFPNTSIDKTLILLAKIQELKRRLLCKTRRFDRQTEDKSDDKET